MEPKVSPLAWSRAEEKAIPEAQGVDPKDFNFTSEERYKTSFGRLQDYPDCFLLSFGLEDGHPKRGTSMQEVTLRTNCACPHCGCLDVYRARSRGIIERHLLRVMNLGPHRCTSCKRRFYARMVSRRERHNEALLSS